MLVSEVGSFMKKRSMPLVLKSASMIETNPINA